MKTFHEFAESLDDKSITVEVALGTYNMFVLAEQDDQVPCRLADYPELSDARKAQIVAEINARRDAETLQAMARAIRRLHA